MAATTGAGGNSDPEDASAFLTRTNFKSIVEWLTAEAILNRPEDPMTYVRDLCDMKLCERGRRRRTRPTTPQNTSSPATRRRLHSLMRMGGSMVRLCERPKAWVVPKLKRCVSRMNDWKDS